MCPGRRPETPFRSLPAIESKERALRCASIADDKKATDIVVLDIRKFIFLTDYFVVCSGQHPRQIHAIADAIVAEFKVPGRRPPDVEGYASAQWVLVDLGDVVVHLFREDRRAFYQLEALWGEARRVRWNGEKRASPDRLASRPAEV